jgi:hypothetical protein
LAIVLSPLTTSDNPFCIFKLFFHYFTTYTNIFHIGS